MRAFKVFIFGLLYGWVLKIAFDRIYRGNEIEDIRNENAALKEHIRALETQIQETSLVSESAKRPASQSQPVETPARTSAKAEQDDLQTIKGIGPVIEKKLNQAGIYTFRALAGLSVEELEGILGNTRRLVQEKDLIAQAEKLARQS
ncbi:MAG TPA: helix-hairpin-helix domain-containing protein [Anaerolineales bacterium]|nr:helix-hairpin-helix domain-containing protein [Anaerolineales bacterium]